nr:Slp family lipoprotein [Saccharobesus litoralis]
MSVAGCSQIPDNLTVPEGTQLTSYQSVLQNLEKKQPADTLVRWGGTIVRVDNLQTKSRIELVNFDLMSSTRPKVSDNSDGRFRIYVNGFLDPEIYQQGRSLSVLGTLTKSELGQVGEHELLFPVVNAQAIHLWKEQMSDDELIRMQHDLWRHHPSYYHQRLGLRYYYLNDTNQKKRSNKQRQKKANKGAKYEIHTTDSKKVN